MDKKELEKINIAKLLVTKHAPDVISAVGMAGMFCTMFDKRTPEERERDLYESLKKKYEPEET